MISRMVRWLILSAMFLTTSSVMLEHLAEKIETYISYSYLLIEVQVDGSESGEVFDIICDISDACIRDRFAASREE